MIDDQFAMGRWEPQGFGYQMKADGYSMFWSPFGGIEVLENSDVTAITPEDFEALANIMRWEKAIADAGGEECGATDGDPDDHIYGTCQLPKGHPGRWHREMRGGKLWDEWSGDSRKDGQP